MTTEPLPLVIYPETLELAPEGHTAPACPIASLRVGDRIRVQRDETRYPSKGTWPHYRGKTGTVVSVNADTERPHLTEYGITFTKKPRVDAWFKRYELAARDVFSSMEVPRGDQQ